MALVCFSHGKESGPQATKITALSKVAESLGHQVLSVDYRGIDDPQARIEKLLESVKSHPSAEAALVLVGSSMGAFVSIGACSELQPVGLYLMAPAVYMPGYEQVITPPLHTEVQIYHGWKDDIVPVDNALRFARENAYFCTLLDDDHRLSQSLPALEAGFARFLKRLF